MIVIWILIQIILAILSTLIVFKSRLVFDLNIYGRPYELNEIITTSAYSKSLIVIEILERKDFTRYKVTPLKLWDRYTNLNKLALFLIAIMQYMLLIEVIKTI